MTDRSVRVILSAVTTGFSAGMARAAADVKGVTSTLEEHRAKLDKVSSAALVGGAAIAAGVGYAVKAYSDFDEAMSKVSATGADARASMDGLRAAALQAGADTKFSATEAAAGVESLLKAGVSASDVMGGGLTGALSLAAAGEMGVGDAAEVAATAMTQFGLAGTDVGHIADLLAAGAGKAQGEVSDMAQALKQSGLIAAQFGLTIDETVGGLTAFASAGLIGSDAGTSLKTMLISLANPSKESAAKMRELGINAYDAGGKFVGLEGLAGQLQSRLGGLTDAQRQQALAQIFGTDAMRAASVLYDQGASGVAKWTAAVGEQGYATTVAAERMNNLKGDIEQLSGSFETAMIKLDASANGPLRGVVQGLTGVVNALGDLPPFAQTAVLGFAGVTAAGLLAVGGFLKVTSTITELKGAWSALATEMPRMAGGLSTVGKNALAAGAALVVMGAGVAAMQASVSAGLPSVKDLGVQLGRISAGSGSVKDLDANFAGLEGRAGSLSEALKYMAARSGDSVSALTKAGDGADALASGLIGAKSDVQGVSEAFQRMDAAIAQMDPAAASAAFATVKDQAAASGLSVDALVKLFPQYSAKLQEAAAAGGQVQTSSEALKGALDGTTSSTTAAKAASEALKASLDAQTQSTRDNANAQLQASGSAIGLESAIAGATASVAAHKANLDLTTEAGRANRSALDQIASSAISLQGAQEKAGASTESLNASTSRARGSFVATAQQMGMTAAQANALADQYGLVPKSVTTSVSQTGAQAATGQVRDLQTQLNALRDRTITIRTIREETRNQVAGNATGGYIRGPGTGTSDSILSWLSNGEYVLRADAVSAIGVARLHYMNQYGKLPGFADGGMVHYAQAAPRYAFGGLASAASTAGVTSLSGPAVVHVYGADGVLKATFDGYMDAQSSASSVSRRMAVAM